MDVRLSHGRIVPSMVGLDMRYPDLAASRYSIKIRGSDKEQVRVQAEGGTAAGIVYPQGGKDRVSTADSNVL